MYTLVDIVGYLISILIMLVITQFVLSLLLSFNVVSRHNQLVERDLKKARARSLVIGLSVTGCACHPPTG